MKIFILLALSFVGCFRSIAQEVSEVKHHGVYVELMGAGIYYSLGYSYNHWGIHSSGVQFSIGGSVFPSTEDSFDEIGFSIPIELTYKIKLHRSNSLNLGVGAVFGNYFSEWNTSFFSNIKLGFEKRLFEDKAAIEFGYCSLLIPYKHKGLEKYESIRYWPWFGIRFNWLIK